MTFVNSHDFVRQNFYWVSPKLNAENSARNWVYSKWNSFRKSEAFTLNEGFGKT